MQPFASRVVVCQCSTHNTAGEGLHPVEPAKKPEATKSQPEPQDARTAQKAPRKPKPAKNWTQTIDEQKQKLIEIIN